jgi:hypothetical protein
MITYKFDADDELYEIILGPSFMTVREESVKRSCNNMRILFKFFKKIFEEKYEIAVKLSERCRPPETSKTSETNGGYKSRRRNRKPARKTHRRGRDRRCKSHYKKYTH